MRTSMNIRTTLPCIVTSLIMYAAAVPVARAQGIAAGINARYLPVTIALVDDFKYKGADVVLLRRADAQPHDIILVKRAKARDAALLAEAVASLRVLRAKQGDVPTRSLVVRIKHGKKRKLQAQAADWIGVLDASAPLPLEGFGTVKSMAVMVPRARRTR